jgi:DNA-binding response OmpR family regulator
MYMEVKKKIFIADDEVNIRAAIKTFLENAGFDVEDFENGDMLLAALSERKAELVILDVMMPGSNGFVVCKEIRKISHIPIIMLTARDSDLDYATGLDLGSDDYLIKPFSPMALVMRVKAIFRRIEFERMDSAARETQNKNIEIAAGGNS